MNTDETRAAFEKWYIEKHGTHMYCQNRWEAYQAATAAAEEKYLGVIREMVGLIIEARRRLDPFDDALADSFLNDALAPFTSRGE
jgi:hypothetical protein